MYYVETCTEFGRFVQRTCVRLTDALQLADELSKKLSMNIVITNELDCVIMSFNVTNI